MPVAHLYSGDLDRRVQLQRQLNTTDENGQPNGALVTIDTVWANVKPAGGREFVASRAAQAVVDATFRIRWRRDLADPSYQAARWIIAFDGKLYDVQAISEIGRRVGLEILGKAREA